VVSIDVPIRRLQRIASSMNARARKYRAPGSVSWQQLAIKGERCEYCGVWLTLDQGSWDHQISFNDGGQNWPDNIVRCCVDCQRRKHTKTPGEYAAHRVLTVTCARPGCGNTYQPRWAEYQRGKARYCSHRCAGSAKGKGW
jgi:hypothetical protein